MVYSHGLTYCPAQGADRRDRRAARFPETDPRHRAVARNAQQIAHNLPFMTLHDLLEGKRQV